MTMGRTLPFALAVLAANLGALAFCKDAAMYSTFAWASVALVASVAGKSAAEAVATGRGMKGAAQ